MDFVKKIQKHGLYPSNYLDKQAMLLRPSGYYNPTSEEKFQKMIDTEIDVNGYNVRSSRTFLH